MDRGQSQGVTAHVEVGHIVLGEVGTEAAAGGVGFKAVIEADGRRIVEKEVSSERVDEEQADEAEEASHTVRHGQVCGV